MRFIVGIFTLFLLVAMILSWPIATVHAGHLEQLSEENSLGAFDELEEWISAIMIGFINFLQRISPLYVLFTIFVGAGLLLIGGLFGSRTLRGMGGSAILASIAAYLIIRNAPAILLWIQNFQIE